MSRFFITGLVRPNKLTMNDEEFLNYRVIWRRVRVILSHRLMLNYSGFSSFNISTSWHLILSYISRPPNQGSPSALPRLLALATVRWPFNHGCISKIAPNDGRCRIPSASKEFTASHRVVRPSPKNPSTTSTRWKKFLIAAAAVQTPSVASTTACTSYAMSRAANVECRNVFPRTPHLCWNGRSSSWRCCDIRV